MVEKCNFRRFLVHAVNFLLSVSFFIAIPGDYDPEGRFSGDGNLYGLLDQNGKSVVPPKYSQIDYAGRGLFIASSVNAHNPYDRGVERYLFNADGLQVQLKVPEGAHFRRILWLGEGLQDSDAPLKKLPQNTLITFIKDNHYGICDLSGKTIVRPIYDFIDIPQDGLTFMVKTIDHVSELSTFNVQSHQVRVLPIKNPVWSGHDAFRYRTFFSEGLAACEIRDEHGYPKFGYIDADGKFVIEPRYREPGPFVNGIASVSLDMGKADTVIDKSGRVISPEFLEVEQFRGEYAIAKCKSLPAGYGIVNRKFAFVVKPDYGNIRAITKYRAYSHLNDVKRRRTEPADYYLCNHSVFSSDCRFLFELPIGCEPNFTELYEGYWRSGSEKPVYFDLSGKEISEPKSIVHDDSNSQVWLLAPNRFLLTVKTDTGNFDPRYWSLGIDQPISRFEMFKRFLEEYNLIGMSFDDVAKLLGVGYSSRLDKPTPDHKTLRYHLISGGCLPEMAVKVKIQISNGKVESWCFDTYRQVTSPITTNVLIVSPKGESGRIPQTIPKLVISPQSKVKQRVLQQPAKKNEVVNQQGNNAKQDWHSWRQRIDASIRKKVRTACEKSSLDPSKNLRAVTTFRVTSDGRILSSEVSEASSSPDFDSLVASVIKSMDGDELLKFPSASRRSFIDIRTVQCYSTAPFVCPVIENHPKSGEKKLLDPSNTSQATRGRITSISGEESTLDNFFAAPKQAASSDKQLTHYGAEKLAWDEWETRVCSGIRDRFQSSTSWLGSSPTYVVVARFRVSKNNQVISIQMVKPSPRELINQIVVNSIKEFNGNELLKFPDNSEREFFDVTCTLSTPHQFHGL